MSYLKPYSYYKVKFFIGAQSMRIGELAKITRCEVQTIRYYEKEGLLPVPDRTSSGYRIYRKEHIEQLNFVRHCRSLDIPLAEIKLLLKYQRSVDMTCYKINQLLDYQIDQVDERMVSLKGLKKQLQALRQTCREPKAAAECGILRALTAPVEDEACACHNLDSNNKRKPV